MRERERKRETETERERNSLYKVTALTSSRHGRKLSKAETQLNLFKRADTKLVSLLSFKLSSDNSFTILLK